MLEIRRVTLIVPLESSPSEGCTVGFHLGQDNKQHHRSVLFSSFHCNGHTFRISSQTQTLKPPSSGCDVRTKRLFSQCKHSSSKQAQGYKFLLFLVLVNFITDRSKNRISFISVSPFTENYEITALELFLWRNKIIMTSYY